MLVRPLSETGDMMPVWSTDQMLTGAKAAAQVVQTRLQFFQGEWWEDENIGFGIPQYLIDTLKSSDINMAAKYISQYISETEGVERVDNVVYSQVGRQMLFGCTVVVNGESESVEVTINGVY